MTAPNFGVDFGNPTLEDWATGAHAAKDNQFWLQTQNDVLTQMRKDLGLLSQAHAEAQQAQNPMGPPLVPPTKSFGEQVRDFFTVQGPLSNHSEEGKRLIQGIGQIQQMPLPELYGRSKALGIENPERIPVDQLRQQLAQRRLDVAPDNFNALRNVASQIANFGIGAAEMGVKQLTQWGQLIAIQPEALLKASGAGSKLSWMKDVVESQRQSDQNMEMFSRLQEGVRANQDASQLGKYQSQVAGVLGSLAGGIIVGTPAWEAASAVAGSGFAASILGKYGTPLMRGALAGAGTSLIFDAGSDKPWLPSEADMARVSAGDMTAEERVLAGVQGIMGNRVLSALTGAALGAIGERAARDFPNQYSEAEQSQRGGGGGGPSVGPGDPEGFAPHGNETVDADWEWASVTHDGPSYGSDASPFGVPDQPLLPRRALSAGEPDIPAMEQRYLRTLPGDMPPEAGPDLLGGASTRPLNGPQGPLPALQGPLNPEIARDMQQAQTNVEIASQNLQRAVLSGDQSAIDQHSMILDNWQRQVEVLNQVPRMIRTPVDIIPELTELRAKEFALEGAVADNSGGYDPTHPMYQELLATKDRITELKAQAGLPKRSADPLHWNWFKDNAPSPATPSRSLVEQYGTVIRHPDGTPIQLYHGSATAFHEIDPAVFHNSMGGSLAGPAFYLTDNPNLAGGDLLEPWDEPGYAGMRANAANSYRAELQTDLNAYQQTVNEYEQGSSYQHTRAQYEHAKMQVEGLTNRIANLQTPAPNVRTAYVAAKKLFDFDQPIDREEGFRIMHTLQQMNPEYDFVDTRDLLSKNPTVPGKVLYDSLNYEETALSRSDPHSHIDDEKLGDARLNLGLEEAGYEGVRYLASQRLGNKRYDGSYAYAIFNPRHVISVHLPDEVVANQAAALGISMSKQAAILQSPAVSDLASRSMFTDADVVAAQVASDPGSYHILQGIKDPGELSRQLLGPEMQTMFDGTLRDFAVVVRNGRFDLITSTSGPITLDQKLQYQRTGLMENMDILKPNGAEAKVVAFGFDGKVKVQTASQMQRGAGGNWFAAERLAPSNVGTMVVPSGDLYNQFKQYAVLETTDRIASSGQVYEGDWFDQSVFTRMPELLKDFLDSRGIADAGVRAGIVRDFNARRVEDAEQFAPDYFDVLHEVRSEAEAVHEAEHSSDTTPNARDYAALRGFNLVPMEGSLGFTLEDTLSEVKLPMADEAAVIEFLNHYQRDLPDHTPAVPFPMELAEVGNDNGLAHQANGDAHAEQLARDIAMMESEDWDPTGGDLQPEYPYIFDAGGGPGGGDPNRYLGDPGLFGGRGGPPTNIPPVHSPDSGGGFPRLPSGRTRDAVRRELRGLEGRMGDLMSRYDGPVMNMLTPMRSIFSTLQDDLSSMGVKGLKPWQNFDDIVVGMTKAHNEANPILNQIAHEMRFVKKRNLRNGTWWSLWEVPDPIQRAEYAKNLGWSSDEIRSFHNIDVILDDMLGGAGGSVEQFKHFVSSVRTAQARGDYSSSAYKVGGDLSSIQHFVDHSLDVGSIFLQNDPRVLIPDFVRSFTFAKHAGDAWNASLDTWRAVDQIQDGIGHRPFAKLASVMLDWMDYVQRGYQPGQDFALSTVQTVVNGALKPFGAKISRGETRAFIQTMQTGFYRGAMGLQLHVMIRDAIQPLLAIPFVGPLHLTAAFRAMAKGSNSPAFEAMLQRAFDAGVAEQSLPRLESPGVFEGLLATNTEGGQMTPENLIARERLAKYSDGVTEILAPNARGWLKRNLDTMRFYTKQGTWHRVIVGEAAHENFWEKYGAWEMARSAAVQQGLPVPTFKQFAKSINLHSWGGAENGSIEASIANGNPTEAAHTYMRLVADRTQFAYGTRHAPPAIRTTTGKLGFMLGNFSVQSLDLVRNIAKTKSLDVLAKMAATVGIVHYLLSKAQDETGIPTRKMSPLYAFTFMGGPLVQAGVGAYQAGQAAMQTQYGEMTDKPINPSNERILTKISVPGVLLGAANQVNPLKGVMQDLKGVNEIMQSGDPLFSAARFLLTGPANGYAVDNEHRLMTQMPEIQQLIGAPQAQQPSLNNPRTISPAVRLPGSSQYNNPATRFNDGGWPPSANERSLWSGVDSTTKFLDEIVRNQTSSKRPGGGAF